jgi:PII-like signaling protein
MVHEKFEGERTLMRIFVGESDKWHGKPLYEAIVNMLRREGFAGVTVLRGVGLRWIKHLSHRKDNAPLAGPANHSRGG